MLAILIFMQYHFGISMQVMQTSQRSGKIMDVSQTLLYIMYWNTKTISIAAHQVESVEMFLYKE